MGTDEAHKAWLQDVVQLQHRPPRRPDVDRKMKWTVREANRRYVEQGLQEYEPGDVLQVDWYSNWLNQQQWKACPIHVIHVVWKITSRLEEEHRTGHERSSTEPIRCRKSSLFKHHT